MVLPKRANGEVGHGPTAPFLSHDLSIRKPGVMKMCTEIPRQQGFTLIEMIGVLAVIAILAALVLPKVFARWKQLLGISRSSPDFQTK